MKITSLFAGTVAALIFCAAASADIIKDPDMAMDAGSFSDPLSKFTSFSIDPTTGGGVLDLYNDTGHPLTSFGLTVNIKPGLLAIGSDIISNNFRCGPTNPFFLDCTISYNNDTGALTYLFSGVNPTDGDETTDDEIGEHEGIPTLKSNCDDSSADTPPCSVQGHFRISFNTNFSFDETKPDGDWSSSKGKNPDLFLSGPVTGELATPEPSAIFLFATVLIAIAVATWKGRRERTAASSQTVGANHQSGR